MDMFLFHLQLNWMVYVIAFSTGLTLTVFVVRVIVATAGTAARSGKFTLDIIAGYLVRMIMIAVMLVLVSFPVWVIGFPNVNRLINATSVTVPAKISKTITPTLNGFDQDSYVLVTSRRGTEKADPPTQFDYRPATKRHPAGSQQAYLTVYQPSKRLSAKDQQAARQSHYHQKPKLKVVKYVAMH